MALSDLGGRVARRALATLERRLLAAVDEPEFPCLFVLGLPRSGTTLVYQYLVDRLPVAYFTQGVGRFPEQAAAITWLEYRVHGRYRSDFHSRYGKIEGAAAPREAGAFFARFFGYDDRKRLEDLGPGEQDALRRTVAAVQRAFGGAPFVNKNVKHLLRIDALAGLFPSAHFLVVERERRDVALSLLRARQALLADPRDWWSVRPCDHERLAALPPAERVVAQLESLATGLETDLAELAPGRVTHIEYERFCAQPGALLEVLAPRLEVTSQVQCTDASPGKVRFTPSHPEPSTAEEAELLAAVEDQARDGAASGSAATLRSSARVSR